MATIKPFAALRPQPELASRICELPYDVMSSEEARELARDNPLSFLHVSKPEIDLPAGTDPCSAAVYARGRENLDRLRSEGALKQDPAPWFHLYRQVMGNHSQTGLVAAVSCQEYRDGILRKHEFTRPEKEDDRVRHMEALNAQTGPVFLTYPAMAEVDELVRTRTGGAPEVDFTAADGVRHTTWSLRDAEEIRLLESLFSRIPRLYIADGHHRSAAAARVFESRRGAGNSPFFLAVVFPHDQMQILPYNRVLTDLHGQSASRFLERLRSVCDDRPGHPATPGATHEFSLYLAGEWHPLRFKAAIANAGNAVERLDVSLLQTHVLAPFLGIEDPRTSRRISFVGGIRGTRELEERVNNGPFACAFSLFPTRIEDLMNIADANGIMPPKSTWFEPKLRDGLFCHLL